MSQPAQAACKSDARAVEIGMDGYHETHGGRPPAGPVDNTSVLLKADRSGPLLPKAPKNDKYSINTDGEGGVLVAVPPARSGGVNYGDAANWKVPGRKNPCDALSND
jgi:hypothetical protein